MKISDLPNISYSDAKYITLIGNSDESEMETGKIFLDNLMSAYLDTQFYYMETIPSYIRTYFIEEEHLDDLLAAYFGSTTPSAVNNYLLTLPYNDTETAYNIVGQWFDTTSTVSPMFEFNGHETEFYSMLSSYVSEIMYGWLNTSDYISGCAAQWFSMPQFTDAVDNYLEQYNFFTSNFTHDLGYWLSENIGDCIGSWMAGGNADQAAALFSVAMSYYISYYGPLPR